MWWAQAWLSMQAARPDGLYPAPAERRRCTMRCIHNATAGAEDTKLVQMWGQRKPVEAREVLSAPDVTVRRRPRPAAARAAAGNALAGMRTCLRR